MLRSLALLLTLQAVPELPAGLREVEALLTIFDGRMVYRAEGL
jgi:hypothetical protein